MIRKLARKASLVLCLEPALPGGALKLERKGRLVVRLDVHGRSAHAGTPEKGVNAVEELVAQIVQVQAPADRRDDRRTSGSSAAARKPTSSPRAPGRRPGRPVLEGRGQGPGAEDPPGGRADPARERRIKIAVESTTPPMEKTKASERLFLRAQGIAADLGIALKGGKTGGGSDASIAAGLGVPTLDGLGPDGDGLHAEHEHLLLPSLVERTALLTELLKDL